LIIGFPAEEMLLVFVASHSCTLYWFIRQLQWFSRPGLGQQR